MSEVNLEANGDKVTKAVLSPFYCPQGFLAQQKGGNFGTKP